MITLQITMLAHGLVALFVIRQENAKGVLEAEIVTSVLERVRPA